MNLPGAKTGDDGMPRKNIEKRHIRLRRVYLHKLFPKRQPAQRVAFAIFLGIFIGVLPTIGFALALTFFACRVFRVPSVPGLVSSFVAIPPTLFFFFYPSGYTLGRLIVQPPPINFDFLNHIAELRLFNVGDNVAWLWQNASGHLLSFLLGITIVALISGIIGYFFSLFIMHHRKKDHANQKLLRARKRKEALEQLIKEESHA